MNSLTHSGFVHRYRAPGSAAQGVVLYAIGQTTLGLALAAKTARGVCAILLGDDAAALRAELADAFPGQPLHEDAESLAPELARVLAFIDNGADGGGITLDIGGTAFQQQVWQALNGIPSGQTRSYGEVARDLNAPEAVRAVAGACAANLLAIAIPCHRVVRGDGAISGYRWGVERKRALLAAEHAR